MLAWEKAQKYWKAHMPSESFEQSVGWHMSQGLVHITRNEFLLASEVQLDGRRYTYGQAPNAWLVYMACTTEASRGLGELMRVFPHELPWVVWARNNENRLRIFDWKKIKNKTMGGQ